MLLTSEEKEKNFQQISELFKTQRKIRDGEIEGMVHPSFHKDAVTLYCYGLIEMHHTDKLQAILQ